MTLKLPGYFIRCQHHFVWPYLVVGTLIFKWPQVRRILIQCKHISWFNFGQIPLLLEFQHTTACELEHFHCNMWYCSNTCSLWEQGASFWKLCCFWPICLWQSKLTLAEWRPSYESLIQTYCSSFYGPCIKGSEKKYAESMYKQTRWEAMLAQSILSWQFIPVLWAGQNILVTLFAQMDTISRKSWRYKQILSYFQELSEYFHSNLNKHAIPFIPTVYLRVVSAACIHFCWGHCVLAPNWCSI